MALSPPPKKNNTDKKASAADEKKIREFINKGGSTAADERPVTDGDALKTLGLKLYASEIEKINELRSKRPKSRSGRKLGISLHDWIVEAVQERIKRETK